MAKHAGTGGGGGDVIIGVEGGEPPVVDCRRIAATVVVCVLLLASIRLDQFLFGCGNRSHLHHHHLDVAVGSEEGELIFTGETKSEGIKMPDDTRALAFDPVQQTLFIGTEDRHEIMITIYKVPLAGDRKLIPILRKKGTDIPGIAYDGLDKMLYWTDMYAIYRMKLDSQNATWQTFMTFDNGEMPWSVAVDSCRRFLYWSNRNHENPSINRVKLNGGNGSEVLITEGLFMPVGLAVDQETEKLFWCDKQENIEYRIECSNLDGSSPETLVSGTYHHPIGIAVGPKNVYWSDSSNKKVWSIPKINGRNSDVIEVDYLASFGLQGIVAWSSAEHLDDNLCHKKPATLEVASQAFIESTTTALSYIMKKLGEHEYEELYCLNGGSFRLEQGIPYCSCQLGYSGVHCEVSKCHNYCLWGNCHLDEHGRPYCICSTAYRGRHCERNKCEDFCMHDGHCYLGHLDEPVCHCADGYGGHRCEEPVGVARICEQLCTQEHHNTILATELMCSCSDYNGLTTLSAAYDNDTWNVLKAEGRQGVCIQEGPQKWIFILLVCSSIILVIVIAFLLLKICHLRRRPRIKKRIIVNKNVAPLTSRPPNSGEQCEITIENCCNMNVCETPCFEPQLRTPKLSSKSDERRNLLVNMEEGASSPPVQQKQY